MVGPSRFRFVTVPTGTVPIFAAQGASLPNSPPFPPRKWDCPPRVERSKLPAAPRERLLRSFFDLPAAKEAALAEHWRYQAVSEALGANCAEVLPSKDETWKTPSTAL